jgi:hypothetical protein
MGNKERSINYSGPFKEVGDIIDTPSAAAKAVNSIIQNSESILELFDTKTAAPTEIARPDYRVADLGAAAIEPSLRPPDL